MHTKDDNRRNNKNNGGDGAEESVVKAHAILIMDSNRRYIDPDKFWHNRKCLKVAAGNVAEATQTIESTVFDGVKHAILHIGTNDVETRKPYDLIGNEIIQVALKIKKATNAVTYISLLPPNHQDLITFMRNADR